MTTTILTAAALLGVSATPLAANVDFVCSGYAQGFTVAVTYFDEEDVASASFQCPGCDTTPFTLFPAPTGSGSLYVSGDVFFREHQGGASLEAGGETGTCQVVRVTEPGGPQAGGPAGALAGISWGGNLRAGPGTQFQDVGSLAEGAPITILQDSGTYFNGYSWFLIQTQTGQQAYQWGGIMCVPGQVVQGIYGNC